LVAVAEVISSDVLVIGTEGTGARTAIEASEHGAKVLAVTKGLVAKSGATLTADGEIDVDSRSATEVFGVDGSSDDSPQEFAADMIREGDFLADQNLAAIHAEEAPARVRELIDWGARLEGFIHAPGHSYPRGLWIPGVKMARLLARQMEKRGVSVLENTMVLELTRDNDGVTGALALHTPTGTVLQLVARAVVLATGGAMRVFPLTTAPEELTGDGLAMAYRCGAELQDMEFPMFLPYTFLTPPALRGAIFSYDASALLNTHALNRHGDRYMARWDPKRMERTTRDINSVAAAVEILEGRGSKAGGTYLSLKHLPRNLVDFSTEWFPENMRGWRHAGFRLTEFFGDPVRKAWEVAPASHFWNGGVRISERCETSVPGLFAAGEGTAGIHGANRLAGNALTMTQVWGKRAGASAAAFARAHRQRPVEEAGRREFTEMVRSFLSGSGQGGHAPIEMRKEIRRVAGDLVGIVRSKDRLEAALERISFLRRELPNQRLVDTSTAFNRELIEALQNGNTLDVLEMVVRASLERKESRGAMYRLDYPMTDDDNWLCNIVITRSANGEPNLSKRAVRQAWLTLPTGQRKYGRKGGTVDGR